MNIDQFLGQKEGVQLENKFFQVCTPIVQELGLELYDLEYFVPNSLLRLYIENPETQTAKIEECAAVDRALTIPFDEMDWIPENLILEVSSPGVFRHLKYRQQFEKVLGDRVELALTRPIEYHMDKGTINIEVDQQLELPRSMKKAKKIIGILKKLEFNDLIINIDGNDFKINMEAIKKANLSPEL